MVPPGGTVYVSPSKVETVQKSPLDWFVQAAGGEAATDFARSLGTLVHAIAQDLPDASGSEYLAELVRRWPTLGMKDNWEGKLDFQRAESMVRKLAQYVLVMRSEGRSLIGVEQDFEVKLPDVPAETGRRTAGPVRRRRKRRAGAARRAPGPGRPAGDRRRGPAGDHRPQDRQTPARQSGSGPAPAAGRLPGRRAGRRLCRVPTTGRRRCRAGPSWPSWAPPPRAPASRPRPRWTRRTTGRWRWSATPPASCPAASSRPATIRPREATAATAAGSPKCARCACGESRLLNEPRGAGNRPADPHPAHGSPARPFPSRGSARRSCRQCWGRRTAPRPNSP